MLIDTHAHLTDERYGGAREIIDNMTADGLERIITVGYDMESSRECKRIAESNAAIYFDAGVHPSDSQRLAADPADELVALCADPKCVAVGEIGLDYHYDDTDRETQRAYFEMQMRVAEMYGLPVVIHDREAHGDCFDMVCRYPKVRGVFHSYSGSAEMAADLIRRGWIVSFSGVVTFKNAERVRAVVKSVPMDKLLIETDCPYLAPHPHRGECNHSGLLTYTAAAIGELHGIDADEVGRITAENAAAFFGITL